MTYGYNSQGSRKAHGSFRRDNLWKDKPLNVPKKLRGKQIKNKNNIY